MWMCYREKIEDFSRETCFIEIVPEKSLKSFRFDCEFLSNVIFLYYKLLK